MSKSLWRMYYVGNFSDWPADGSTWDKTTFSLEDVFINVELWIGKKPTKVVSASRSDFRDNPSFSVGEVNTKFNGRCFVMRFKVPLRAKRAKDFATVLLRNVWRNYSTAAVRTLKIYVHTISVICHVGNAGSHQTSKVKQYLARSILKWVAMQT
jgi:hypothetical protein